MARPTRKMTIIAVAVVALAAIGGAATYLATSPTAFTSSAQGDASTGHGKAGKSGKEGRSEKAKARKAERGGGAGGMLGKIEHGEFTTASTGVVQIQRGAITAIDAGSLTVRSADGFTASYQITPTTTVGKGGKGKKVAAQVPAAPAVPAPAPAAPAPAAGVAPGAAPGAGVAPGAASVPGDATGVARLKAGDTVQVMATKTDSGSTATRIAPTRT